MTVKGIEKQLMKLDVHSRAKVAQKLLHSLDELSEAENEQLWAEEALRRHDELTKGRAKLHPASRVVLKARAQLK
jgi:hypothetical protein